MDNKEINIFKVITEEDILVIKNTNLDFNEIIENIENVNVLTDFDYKNVINEDQNIKRINMLVELKLVLKKTYNLLKAKIDILNTHLETKEDLQSLHDIEITKYWYTNKQCRFNKS